LFFEDLQRFEGEGDRRGNPAAKEAQVAFAALRAFAQVRLKSLMKLREPAGVKLCEIPLEGVQTGIKQPSARKLFLVCQSEQSIGPGVVARGVFVAGGQGQLLVAFHLEQTPRVIRQQVLIGEQGIVDGCLVLVKGTQADDHAKDVALGNRLAAQSRLYEAPN